MASGLGLFVVLLGAALVVFGYSDLSLCLSLANIPQGLPQGTSCWDPIHEPYITGHDFSTSAIAFYVGIIIGISGVVMLVGGDIAKLLRKSKVE